MLTPRQFRLVDENPLGVETMSGRRIKSAVELDARIGELAARALNEILNEGRPTRSGLTAQKVLRRIFDVDQRTLKSRLLSGLYSDRTWRDELKG